MSTEAFASGMRELLELFDGYGEAAIMCSETLWRRCHRRIVSDRLVVDGIEVRQLGIGKKVEAAEHPLWDAARVDGKGGLIYGRKCC